MRWEGNHSVRYYCSILTDIWHIMEHTSCFLQRNTISKKRMSLPLHECSSVYFRELRITDTCMHSGVPRNHPTCTCTSTT